MVVLRVLAALLLVPMFAACLEDKDSTGPSDPTDSTPTAPAGPFSASSTAFQPGQRIPKQYTCDGTNKNPVLSFANLPLNATHVALIMEDPDVPNRLAPQRVVEHWVFWNLPRVNTTIPADGDAGPVGAKVGRPYRGPCPPDGSGEHRYFFYASAQTKPLDLADGSNATVLRQALQGNIAATYQFLGVYSRPCVSPVCN